MDGTHFFSVRGARLVAGGRAVLAFFLVASILFGALQPSGGEPLVRPLIVGYLAYSLVLLAVSQSRSLAHHLLWAPYLPSLIDVAAFTSLLYLTKGAESPFFSPLLFLILSATVQWGSRGAIWMGVVTAAVFFPAGASSLIGDGDRASLTSLVRFGTISVVVVLAAAFAQHLERVMAELSRLSDPMDEAAAEGDPPVREVLAHALNVFDARRGALIWSERDEPRARVLMLDAGRLNETSVGPTGEDWLVDPALATSVFLYERQEHRMLVRREGRAKSWKHPPLSEALAEILRFRRALVIPVVADPIEAWVLILDHDEPASEDLAVGGMVGAQIAVSFDRWLTHRTRRETAAAQDRMRLARDLHDGVLQFLAGAALQLDGLVRSDELSQDAKDRLASLRLAISDEQRELRAFITAMRPRRRHEPNPPERLDEGLEELAQRLSRYWGVTVSAEVTPTGLAVTDGMAYDIGRIVREAVANAVRHGRAGRVSVTAHGDADRLLLQIDDDGQGFPFPGRHSHEELAATGRGPRSLHERARALNGRLALDTSGQGASVTIDVPMERNA